MQRQTMTERATLDPFQVDFTGPDGRAHRWIRFATDADAALLSARYALARDYPQQTPEPTIAPEPLCRPCATVSAIRPAVARMTAGTRSAAPVCRLCADAKVRARVAIEASGQTPGALAFEIL